jgi:hypothetical protein
MSYQQMNQNSMVQFEEQKTLQILQDSDGNDQEKLAKLGEVLKKVTAISTQALAQNIAMVRTPQAQVIEQEHISEWLSNCDRSMFSRIRDYIISNKEKGEIPDLNVKCNSCSHEYKQPFTLDMSNFFGAAS